MLIFFLQKSNRISTVHYINLKYFGIENIKNLYFVNVKENAKVIYQINVSIIIVKSKTFLIYVH